MKSAPMMTAAEELTLISRWREGDQRALDRLIAEHQPLVRTAVNRFRGHYSTDDLMQEGNVGLMLALHKFDPSRGFRFNTYARWWVRAAITEYYRIHRCLVSIPLGNSRQPRKAAPQVWPIDMRQRLPEPRSIQGDMPTLAEMIPSDAPTPEDHAVSASNVRLIRASMQKLQQRERFIIEQRMDEDSTLKGVGLQLGISQERVRQIEARAMRLLKADLTMPRRVEGRA